MAGVWCVKGEGVNEAGGGGRVPNNKVRKFLAEDFFLLAYFCLFINQGEHKLHRVSALNNEHFNMTHVLY
jgi:hypothetical protein